MTEFDRTPVRTAHGESNTFYVDPFVVCCFDVFGFFSLALENCDLSSAIDDGFLSNADYADYHFVSFLGIFSTMEVTAYGSKHK